jgi:hypothetical protein
MRCISTIIWLAVWSAGCSDNSGPSAEAVAGSYSATAFTVSLGGGTDDWIARGGALTLALSADATFTGRMFNPGGDTTGENLDLPLTGAWSLNDGVVRFVVDQARLRPEPLFLEELVFLVGPDRLETEGIVQGQTINLILRRSTQVYSKSVPNKRMQLAAASVRTLDSAQLRSRRS